MVLTYLEPAGLTEEQADELMDRAYDLCEGHQFLRQIDLGITLGPARSDAKVELEVVHVADSQDLVVAAIDELMKDVLHQDFLIPDAKTG